jgi:serine phosphatase RsbU (regulator of sigma subunit)
LNAFNEADVTAMETLTTQIASAIENAHLYEKIKESKEQLQEKNENIMSSIRYAKTIQHAILPLDEKIESAIPEHFIIFKPKDIVSGDFYWFNQIDNKVVIAVVDCTGHGVPGAFMSMIGNTLLNEIVNEQRITDPALVLENLHSEVRFALKQEDGTSETQDGMDVCLCVLEEGRKNITFSGAKRPLYIVRNGKSTPEECEFIEIRGDRKSIGGKQREEHRTFTNHEFEVRSGDVLYLTTDGLIDQNNSENKKYSTKRLTQFFRAHAGLALSDQREALLADFTSHQGDELQRDDITLVGVKV